VSGPAALDAARVGHDGTLRLALERRGGATVVARCLFTLPLQVLAPLALDDPAAIISILNPTGGLVGGDRLSIDVDAGADAHAVLTTPSATRVYRTDGEPATQAVRLRLGPRAVVEWVPDQTIPFAGSAFRQAIDVEMADGAGLVLVDAFSAGRIARGEAWRFALLESALSVRDRRGWLLHDRFVLRPACAPDQPAWDGLGLAEAHAYMATIAVLGAFDAASFAADVAHRAAGRSDAHVGVAQLARAGVLVRCLAARAPALAEAVDEVWGAARAALLGLPPLALRKP
jgi:urease accessory protein